jgi:hypothetical protein
MKPPSGQSMDFSSQRPTALWPVNHRTQHQPPQSQTFTLQQHQILNQQQYQQQQQQQQQQFLQQQHHQPQQPQPQQLQMQQQKLYQQQMHLQAQKQQQEHERHFSDFDHFPTSNNAPTPSRWKTNSTSTIQSQSPASWSAENDDLSDILKTLNILSDPNQLQGDAKSDSLHNREGRSNPSHIFQRVDQSHGFPFVSPNENIFEIASSEYSLNSNAPIFSGPFSEQALEFPPSSFFPEAGQTTEWFRAPTTDDQGLPVEFNLSDANTIESCNTFGGHLDYLGNNFSATLSRVSGTPGIFEYDPLGLNVLDSHQAKDITLSFTVYCSVLPASNVISVKVLSLSFIHKFIFH